MALALALLCWGNQPTVTSEASASAMKYKINLILYKPPSHPITPPPLHNINLCVTLFSDKENWIRHLNSAAFNILATWLQHKSKYRSFQHSVLKCAEGVQHINWQDAHCLYFSTCWNHDIRFLGMLQPRHKWNLWLFISILDCLSVFQWSYLVKRTSF